LAESKEREKQVRMEMYGVLVGYVEPKVLVEMVDQLMRLLKVVRDETGRVESFGLSVS